MALPFPKDRIIKALLNGSLDLHGQFIAGSNSTFLGDLVDGELHCQAVYKPVKGEMPLWDFATGTLSRREVAAYTISEALGWNLVPPTIFRRRKLPFGAGSLQYYVKHDPDYHYFHFTEADRQRLRPVAAFDLLINNADRKGGHILADADGGLWLIDHGVCFHVEDKLRTVVWDFAGEPVPGELLEAVEHLLPQLLEDGPLYGELAGLLTRGEIAALGRRAFNLLQKRVYPEPDAKRRQVPWPPV